MKIRKQQEELYVKWQNERPKYGKFTKNGIFNYEEAREEIYLK